MTYVWGVAFGKDIGAEKTPHSSSARCVSTFYAFFALIVANTYCANLMAFLVQETLELPISGIRDSKVTELNFVVVISVPDPDLEIRGSRSSRPWDKERARSPKNFSALRASFYSKNKRGSGSPGPLPWIRHWIWMILPQYYSFEKLCGSGLVSTCLYSPVPAKQNLYIALCIIKLSNASIFPPAQYVNILRQMETTL